MKNKDKEKNTAEYKREKITFLNELTMVIKKEILRLKRELRKEEKKEFSH
ncbi:MAG: hypothetical protein ACRCUM_03820 [Mycoplasmoidaceae bacterium]